jgi:hypothetical protein
VKDARDKLKEFRANWSEKYPTRWGLLPFFCNSINQWSDNRIIAPPDIFFVRTFCDGKQFDNLIKAMAFCNGIHRQEKSSTGTAMITILRQ